VLAWGRAYVDDAGQSYLDIFRLLMVLGKFARKCDETVYFSDP